MVWWRLFAEVRRVCVIYWPTNEFVLQKSINMSAFSSSSSKNVPKVALAAENSMA